MSTTGSTPSEHARRARLLLSLGAAAGLAAVAVGLLSPTRRLPSHAVARVNDSLISSVEYERAVAALAADSRSIPSEADRQHVLDRLIDEELLVQHALDLELPRHDARVRADLVAGVIQALVATAADTDPRDAELEAFYREHVDYFARPGRARIAQILMRSEPVRSQEQALARAREAARRLRTGEPFALVKSELGDAEVARLPDTYLSPGKLREYLGPSATRAALSLAPGKVSDPVSSGHGYTLVFSLGREPGVTPELAEIEAEVRSEWVRRAGDAALRGALDDLRRRAEIEQAPGVP